MAKYGYIGNNPDNTPVIIARQVYNPTGVQTNFTFNAGYTPGYLDVYLNGVKLLNVSDYSATNGSVVGITSAAQNGDSVEIVAYKAFTIGQSILGISSAGTSVRSTGVNVLNFVGAAVTDVGGNQLDISITPGITTADVSTSSLVVVGISTLGNVTAGVATANQFSGNITGTAATFTGNVTVGGTLTYDDVTNIDSIGLITARNGLQVTGGIATVTGQTNLANVNVSGVSTFSDTTDFKGAIETVSVGATSFAGAPRVTLECDAQNGTVFTHDLSNGAVGIVSLRNFPVTKNSVTTFSIIFTQNATGTANTTAATGIGTNITLTPSGVAGFTTSARVATASTVTLSTTANDVDIVTLAVHYNGSGTGTPGNYRVFATNNSGYRFGTIGF